MSYLDLSVPDAMTLRFSDVTIAHADILTLPTTPVELVAAPGAGKRIVPIHIDLQGNFAAGAYTNIDPNDAAIWAEIGGSAWDSSYLVNYFQGGEQALSSFLALATDTQVQLLPYQMLDLTYGLLAPVRILGLQENQPLNLIGYNNAAGNFTGGNAANTLRVRTIFYVV